MEYSIVYSINDLTDLFWRPAADERLFFPIHKRHICGLLTNNFSHIFLEIKNSRSVYAFEQVLPYRATISVVLKWQFCMKWLIPHSHQLNMFNQTRFRKNENY